MTFNQLQLRMILFYEITCNKCKIIITKFIIIKQEKIQNELSEQMANHTAEEIIKRMPSIICYCNRDINNVEQMSLALVYVCVQLADCPFVC